LFQQYFQHLTEIWIAGVTVTLHITYYHRFLVPEKAKNKKLNRDTYPMLILLGIATGFTAGLQQRMM